MKLEVAAEWLKLRKKSVIAHWLYGALCAVVALLFFPAALVLLGIFAGLEYWEDRSQDTHEGCSDWWDAFIIFIIGFAVLVILHVCDIVSIIWN